MIKYNKIKSGMPDNLWNESVEWNYPFRYPVITERG